MLHAKKVKKYVLSLIALAILAVGGVGITASAMAEKPAPTVIDETKEAKGSQAKEETSGGSSGELISVKPSDETKFRPEEWQRILSQIEKGVISWEDEDGNAIPNDVGGQEAVYDPKDQKVEAKPDTLDNKNRVEKEK